jgi:hypothetical protein
LGAKQKQTAKGCYLLEGLHSAALYEVIVWFGNPPVDLAIQFARLWHSKVVLLAVEVIKQGIQPCCDVPPALQDIGKASVASCDALLFS